MADRTYGALANALASQDSSLAPIFNALAVTQGVQYTPQGVLNSDPAIAKAALDAAQQERQTALEAAQQQQKEAEAKAPKTFLSDFKIDPKTADVDANLMSLTSGYDSSYIEPAKQLREYADQVATASAEAERLNNIYDNYELRNGIVYKKGSSIPQPSGFNSTREIKQALVATPPVPDVNAVAKPNLTGDPSVTSTNSPQANAGSGAGNKGTVENEGALEKARNEKYQQNLTTLDDYAAVVDPNGSGVGTLGTNALMQIKNIYRTSMMDKEHALGKQFSMLGGSAGVIKMADDILSGKSVDDMVLDHLNKYKDVSPIGAKNEENVASSLVNKIGQISAEYNIHPAVAANILFQSLDGSGWNKHWTRLDDDDLGSNTVMLNNDIKARVERLRPKQQELENAFSKVLELRQLQKNVDNYEKQIDGLTSPLIAAQNYLTNIDPNSERKPMYEQKYLQSVGTHRNLSSQYIQAIKDAITQFNS